MHAPSGRKGPGRICTSNAKSIYLRNRPGEHPAHALVRHRTSYSTVPGGAFSWQSTVCSRLPVQGNTLLMGSNIVASERRTRVRRPAGHPVSLLSVTEFLEVLMRASSGLNVIVFCFLIACSTLIYGQEPRQDENRAPRQQEPRQA